MNLKKKKRIYFDTCKQINTLYLSLHLNIYLKGTICKQDHRIPLDRNLGTIIMWKFLVWDSSGYLVFNIFFQEGLDGPACI